MNMHNKELLILSYSARGIEPTSLTCERKQYVLCDYHSQC